MLIMDPWLFTRA